jgi:hypothetical protein
MQILEVRKVDKKQIYQDSLQNRTENTARNWFREKYTTQQTVVEIKGAMARTGGSDRQKSGDWESVPNSSP